MKYNFSRKNKIFINENLTRANESIAFCGRKLKRNSKIHSCFTRDGIVFIKKTEKSKAFKVHHMNVLYDAFREFDFAMMMGLSSTMMFRPKLVVNPHIDLTS